MLMYAYRTRVLFVNSMVIDLINGATSLISDQICANVAKHPLRQSSAIDVPRTGSNAAG